MKKMICGKTLQILVIMALAWGGTWCQAGASQKAPLLFLSTQLTPFEEATKMREIILKDFKRPVDFQPNDNRLVFEYLLSQSTSGKVKPCIVGGLHGDFVSFQKSGGIAPCDDVLAHVKHDGMIGDFIEMGKIDTSSQYYIPWMQATYLMAANKKALKYLPDDANIDQLTYEQLKNWAANIMNATQEAKLGFPAGKKGLMHRFLQGSLYPSFTGGMVTKFKSDDAKIMWTYLKNLWPLVNEWSMTFSNMAEPLLTDEVWIAWDHTARLSEAFQKRPDEFVAFPCPAGPKGRGFMVVLAGLGLPRNSADKAGAQDVISYLVQPEVQSKMLETIGFFPVISLGKNLELSPGLGIMNEAVKAQATSGNALPALLPMGLGGKNQAFNSAYLVTFSQIVLRRIDISSVLEKQSSRLKAILAETHAGCWPPDKMEQAPCPIE